MRDVQSAALRETHCDGSCRCKGAPGWPGGLRSRWPAVPAGCPAVLGPVAPRRNSLRARCACAALKQAPRVGLNVARCARGPQALRSSAPPIRPPGHPSTPLRTSEHFDRSAPKSRTRWAACGCGDLWSAETRRTCGPRAQRATFNPYRRRCLSAAPRSGAERVLRRGRAFEHRRGAGPKGRPRNHEPQPHAARRAARHVAQRFLAALGVTRSR